MSGHSKWSTIKRKKGAEDAKRGQIFTKLGNMIAIAARHGGDPDMNPALELAIEKARAANMPLANIERSIKRGSGELGGEQISELLFEAYGPGGIAVIIETATDNRNRTTSEMKSNISKSGGNLAESGAVAFQFDRKGVIRVSAGTVPDETTLTALDCGAQDVVEAGGELIVYTDLKDLHATQEKLKNAGLTVIESEPQFVPKELHKITEPELARKAIKFLETIEEDEDVTNTFTNFDIDEEHLSNG